MQYPELYQNLVELYDGTLMFNSIAGQLQSITQASLDHQAKLCLDEAIELTESKTDKVNALKEAIDVLVTAFGYLQKLEEAYGCDTGLAMNIVNGNNLSKFAETAEDLIPSVRMYMDKGIKVDVQYDNESGLYCLKDESGKVRKPDWYEDADLSICFPTEN
jgi:hypothetical protein